MFGLGGIFVEALRDVAFRIAPLDDVEALAMTTCIRGARLLDAFRGMPAVNRDALASVIRRVGQLAVDHPEIAEIDVNPLLVAADGVIAVDGRVKRSGARPEHHRYVRPAAATGSLTAIP